MEKTLHLLLILLLVGCSTRVEVSTERPVPSHSAAVKKSSTKVAVDLLTHQQEDAPPRPQPPAPTEAKPSEVEVAGIANFAIVVEGDLHLHQHDHLHLEFPPAEDRPARRRHQEKSQPVEIEARSAGIDPRCERLLRQHVERVEAWRAMLGL